MDRAEKAGLGIAIAGHAVLFGLLSVGFLATPNPANLKQQPIDVQLVDEVALTSTAPNPVSEPPPALSPEPAPLDMPAPEPLVRAETRPAQVPKPAEAKPQKKPEPKPAAPAKPQAKAEPPQRKSRLSRAMLEGLTDTPSESRATGTPAQQAGPAVQASLAREVLRQLKPHWTAPTGADAEKLRTELAITLARDGTVTNIEFLRQTGITDSNRAQMQLHRERAIKAVRLASPFRNLPPQFYDTWKLLSPIGFDKRLSQ